MKKIPYIFVPIILLSLIVCTYNVMLSPTDSIDEVVLYKVEQGDTITEIARGLKDQKLIRSVFAFKVYTKIKNLNRFQSGYYEISPTMDSMNIASKINTGDVVYPDEVKITFKEGINLDSIAESLSEKTNYTHEEILKVWNSREFLHEVINRYDFITKDILDSSITFPLNGYFFPETYFFTDKDVSPQEIAFRMLDAMEDILNKYKEAIEKSPYTIHEILTLASMVEYEAKEEQDRSIIAGVFINRLNNNMKLESCATLEMATGMHKEQYSYNDTKVNSPYNTYQIQGLPIGPGNCPGESSIKAALYPAKHDYLFFLSDVYGDNKVYYAKTLTEHNKLKAKYLR